MTDWLRDVDVFAGMFWAGAPWPVWAKAVVDRLNATTAAKVVGKSFMTGSTRGRRMGIAPMHP